MWKDQGVPHHTAEHDTVAQNVQVHQIKGRIQFQDGIQVRGIFILQFPIEDSIAVDQFVGPLFQGLRGLVGIVIDLPVGRSVRS